jgi:two-component system, LytTR family, response regulator
MNDIIINCLVLDDEQHAIDVLEEHIKDTPYLHLTIATTDIKEAITTLNKEAVDLIFLDVQMPGITGIEFIEMLKGNYHIVISSAYSQYAMDAFEHDVVDFLLKPVTYPRFLKATQKVIHLVKAAQVLKIAEPDTETHMFVKNGVKGKVLKIPFEELDYAEAQKNYVCFYLHHGQIITYMTITEAEGKLPAKNFLRVHRSFIVNMNNIIAIEGNLLTLRNREYKVPVGESYKEKLFSILKIK